MRALPTQKRAERKYRLGFGHGEGTQAPLVGTFVWMQVRDGLRWERHFIQGPYIHHVAGIHGHWGTLLGEACRYIPHLQADSVEPDVQELKNWWGPLRESPQKASNNVCAGTAPGRVEHFSGHKDGKNLPLACFALIAFPTNA